MRRVLFLLPWALLACGDRTATDVPTVPPCRGAPWLVFELSKGTSFGLYAMRADGSDGHTLELPNQGAFPSFSADGTKVAYVMATTEADDAGYLDALVVQDLVTGATLQLATSLVQNDVEEETAALTYSAISPDGSSVAYTAGFDMRAVNLDGTNDRLLLAGSTCENTVYGYPSFTEDSGRVLYGTAGAFGAVGVDGSNAQTLVNQDGVAGPMFPNPTPSADGTSVASVIQCAGLDAGAMDTTLRIYPLASLPASCESGVVVTTLDDEFSAFNGSANPSWGPSGLIAYGSGRDIWVVAPDGGPPRNMTRALTGKTGTAVDPVWAPACAPIP